MVIVMQEGASDEQIQRVIDRLVAMGFDIHRSTGATHTVLGAVGIKTDFDPRDIELLDGVREVVRITQPYKLASRHFRPEGTIVDVGKGVRIGGNDVIVAGGARPAGAAGAIPDLAGVAQTPGGETLRGGG